MHFWLEINDTIPSATHFIPDNRNDTTVHSRLAARKPAISIYNIVWICGTMVSLTSCHRG